MKKIAALVLVTLIAVLAIMPVAFAASWETCCVSFAAKEGGSVDFNASGLTYVFEAPVVKGNTVTVKHYEQGYDEVPVTVTATPDKGYRFVKWEITENEVLSFMINYLPKYTYTAVFEEIPYDPETKQPEGWQGFYEAPAAEVTEVATVETVTAPQTADHAPIALLAALAAVSAAAFVACKK